MKPIINIKIDFKKKIPNWLRVFAPTTAPIILTDRRGRQNVFYFPIGIRVGIKRSRDARFSRVRDLFFFEMYRYRVGKDSKKVNDINVLQMIKELKNGKIHRISPEPIE